MPWGGWAGEQPVGGAGDSRAPLSSGAAADTATAADVQRPVRRLGLLRAALYALALLLLILGVGNQGMRDVLVKAIQICTECIGLG